MPDNTTSIIPPGVVPGLLQVIMALRDAQASASKMAELQSDALERILGLEGTGGVWPNAEEAAQSVDYVRGKMVGMVDPLACALCCVTKTLTADGCESVMFTKDA